MQLKGDSRNLAISHSHTQKQKRHSFLKILVEYLKTKKRIICLLARIGADSVRFSWVNNTVCTIHTYALYHTVCTSDYFPESSEVHFTRLR